MEFILTGCQKHHHDLCNINTYDNFNKFLCFRSCLEIKFRAATESANVYSVKCLILPILQSSLIFSYSKVHPVLWYRTCANAYCLADTEEEKEEVKCATIAAYARELAMAGKPISWRNAFTCRMFTFVPTVFLSCDRSMLKYLRLIFVSVRIVCYLHSVVEI